MAANCVVADLFGLPNGVNDALFSTILVTNINYEQRSTLSSTLALFPLCFFVSNNLQLFIARPAM